MLACSLPRAAPSPTQFTSSPTQPTKTNQFAMQGVCFLFLRRSEMTSPPTLYAGNLRCCFLCSLFLLLYHWKSNPALRPRSLRPTDSARWQCINKILPRCIYGRRVADVPFGVLLYFGLLCCPRSHKQHPVLLKLWIIRNNILPFRQGRWGLVSGRESENPQRNCGARFGIW